jgi:type II secretory pathway pseudopilin PulG
MRCRRDESGLTLVELVVSVSITGVIAVALSSAIFVGLRTTRDTRTSLTQSNTEQLVTTYVAKDVLSSDTEPAAGAVCGGPAVLVTTAHADALGAANVTVAYRLSGNDLQREVCGGASHTIAHDVTAFSVTKLNGTTFRIAVATAPSSEVAAYSFSFDVRRRPA